MGRLEEIWARVQAATAGPWDWQGEDLISRSAFEHLEQWMIDDGYKPEPLSIIVTDSGAYPPRENDRPFIAAARADIPWLLAEVAWLRGELRDTIHEHWCGTDVCECRPLSERHHDDPEGE